MEKAKPKFDFESFKQEALSGLYAGQSLNGEKGVFGPLIKHLLESALEGELNHHPSKDHFHFYQPCVLLYYIAIKTSRR
nr:hypothetical protein [Haliscomenobacter hydrossis]